MTTVLPSLSSHLPPSASLEYLQAATSQNTRRAYQQDIRHFVSSGAMLPATTETVMRYLHQYATLLSHRTLKRRLTALRHWHTTQGFADPTAHPLVRKTLTGIARVTGKPIEKASALTMENLASMSQWLILQSQLAAFRDNAVLQTGFFGAFRRSELVAIRWEHIDFVPEGMTILIPRAKTDQSREGQRCAIPHGQWPLCPVKALQQWQQQSNLSEGAVFRAITKGEHISEKALSAGSISTIIKSIAKQAGLVNPEYYSGHSLRRGFATAASQQGVSLRAIMRQGRWHHEGTVHGYIEEGQQFDANAAGDLLHAYSSPQSSKKDVLP